MFETHNTLKAAIKGTGSARTRNAVAAALLTALLPGIVSAQTTGKGPDASVAAGNAQQRERELIHSTNFGNLNTIAAWRAFQLRRGQMPAARLGSGGGGSSKFGWGATLAPAVPTASNRQKWNAIGTRAATAAGNNIGLSAGKWTVLGPYRMIPPYQNTSTQRTLGPLNSYLTGRANGVAYDPTDRSGGTAYVAAAGGGVWKTINNGVSWTPVGDSTFPIQKTTSVAVNPKNGLNVFIGLGDFNDTSNGFGAGTGIMRTSNGGASWVNIGINEMSGTAVSAIAIDPDNPLIITATCGRGTRAGSIYRSVDGGNTFAAAAGVPAGNWSDIEIGAKDPVSGTRNYYAARINDGAYRSVDRGVSWTKITNVINPATNRVNVDLVFNFQTANPGGAGIQIAASATDPKGVYVLDANSSNNDARIYKSSDSGATWRSVTGNLLIDAGTGNNWVTATQSLVLKAFPNTSSGSAQDLVYNGGRTLSGSLSLGFAELDWTDIGQVLGADTATTHADQRDMSVNPANPNLFLVANAGGVYGLTYFPVDGSPEAGLWDFTQGGRLLNATLAISQLVTADWSRQNPLRMVGGTVDNGVAASFDSGDGSGIPAWGTLDIFVPRRYDNPIPGFRIGSAFDDDGAAIAFDPVNDQVQYAQTPGANPDIFYTQNGWASAIDISPDTKLYHRLSGTNLFNAVDEDAKDANGASPVNVYPTVAANSTLATEWLADRRLSTGVLVVAPIAIEGRAGNPNATPPITAVPAQRPLYTGGQYLWRYQPNTAETFPATLTPAPNPLNGRWRSKIGNTQFTTSGSISVITPSDTDAGVIYVGTTDGQVWVTFNALKTDATTGASTATFRKISDTLPGRPVTSISINPDRTQSGVPNIDIIVSLGGIAPANEGHVYRAADVTAQNVLFTKQDGIGIGTLPNVAAVGVVRDPDDATNTWYLGTDLGVFTTVDGGSSWSDASTPLGLPNVEVSAIKVIKYPDGTKRLNVATYGRGFWQFDVTSAVKVTAPSALTISPAYSRTGGRIYVTLNVKNTGGTATNARVTASSLTVGTAVTVATTTLPLTLGTIGNNTNKTGTVAFPGTVGRLGTSAILKATITYTNAAGALQTFTYTSPRTRLP